MKIIGTVAVLLDGQIWSWKASANAYANSLNMRYFPPGTTAEEMYHIVTADKVKGVGLEVVEGEIQLRDDDEDWIPVHEWFRQWPVHPNLEHSTRFVPYDTAERET